MERRMEILVIGGNRFMGKKVVQTLFKEHNITVLNRKGTSPVECNIIQQDRNELKELKEYDIVIDMCLYNLEQTKNIVDILKKQQNLQQYIFISSIASELEFFGEYGKQKQLAEKYIMYSDLPWIILKPTYVLGTDNPHDRESYYIRKTLNNETIEIDGEGNQPLSFVFSSDVVKVIDKIIKEKIIHKSYNLCSDDVVTLKEFTTIVSDIIGKKANIQYNSNGGPFENKKCIFSNQQTKKDLNIKFKSFKQGITDYYEWYKISQS
jgi:nucleoside-diphosphate-sugar epimerase